MNLSLPYGNGQISLDLPSSNINTILSPSKQNHIPEPRSEILRALNNPINCSRLGDLTSPTSRVLIIADDNTRMTPAHLIVPAILEELNNSGIADKQVKILTALGTHRPMTTSEIKAKFGLEVVSRVEVINHDFRNPSVLCDFGTTENGTPIKVNRLVLEADITIGIGSIVPHHIPGFSGGAKIVQPGICGEETTAETHLLSVRSRRSMLGILENPVRTEMEAIAVRAGVNYVFNTVLDQEGQLIKGFFGDIRAAFREGVKTSKEVYGIPAPGLSPIVLASSYPCDLEFWQAHKTLYPCDMLVEEGGCIIIVTPCPEGIAVTHPELLNFANQAPEDINQQIIEGIIKDKVAGALALAWSKIRQRAEICLVSSGIDADMASKVGFTHAFSVKEALAKSWARLGNKADLTVLTHGGDILPILPGTSDSGDVSKGLL